MPDPCPPLGSTSALVRVSEPVWPLVLVLAAPLPAAGKSVDVIAGLRGADWSTRNLQVADVAEGKYWSVAWSDQEYWWPSARVGVPTETLPPLVTKPLEVGTAIVSPSVSSPMVNSPAICAAAMLLVSFAESVATWAPPRLLMPMNPAAALPQPWLAAPPASTGVG